MMKLVREHINERMGFTEDGDPIHDMGIGSKLVIFINKLDIIAKRFKFKKMEDISSDQSEDWEDTRVLAVWKRGEEEMVKLWNNKTDDIEDEDEYWILYDVVEGECGSDPAIKGRWLNPHRWRDIF